MFLNSCCDGVSLVQLVPERYFVKLTHDFNTLKLFVIQFSLLSDLDNDVEAMPFDSQVECSAESDVMRYGCLLASWVSQSLRMLGYPSSDHIYTC